MRISVTSLLSYDQCPRKWAFNREGWGEKEEKWPGMLQGTVLHETVNAIAKGVKVDTDEKLNDLINVIAMDTFHDPNKSDQSIMNNVKKFSPGVRRAIDKFPISWEEVRTWDSEVEVEAEIGGHTLNGRIDLLKRDPHEVTLVDIKTSQVDEIEHLLWNSQNRYYALILNKLDPTLPIWYEYWCLTTDSKPSDRRPVGVLMTDRHFKETEEEVLRLFDLVESREKAGLDHKDFPRMNMSNCKFCQFKGLCRMHFSRGEFIETDDMH